MPTWGFLPAVFYRFGPFFEDPGLGAGFLNLWGKMERTAKEWGKTGKTGKMGEKWPKKSGGKLT